MASFDVFLSYNHADRALTENLKRFLEKHGFSCWMDEPELRAGEAVKPAIQRALKSSRVLCAVVTPSYGGTYWTRAEAEHMQGEEGLLAPTRVVPCLFQGSMPAFLGERSYVDFRVDPSAAERKLIQSIRSHLNTQQARNRGAWLAAAGAALFGLIAAVEHEDGKQRAAGERKVKIARRRIERIILQKASHQALGRFLKEQGCKAPSTKKQRVATVMRRFSVNIALVRALLTANDLRSLLDMPSATESELFRELGKYLG